MKLSLDLITGTSLALIDDLNIVLVNLVIIGMRMLLEYLIWKKKNRPNP
jgi:hypothetical protein